MAARSNVKIARQLKEAQRGERLNASRRAVTASKGTIASASCQAEAAARAASSNDRYEDTLNKLNKFRKKHGQKAKMGRHKLDWIEEHKQLKKQYKEAAQYVAKTVSGLLEEGAALRARMSRTASGKSRKSAAGSKKGSNLPTLAEGDEDDEDEEGENFDKEYKESQEDMCDHLITTATTEQRLEAERRQMSEIIIKELQELRAVFDDISEKRQAATSEQEIDESWFFTTSSSVAQLLLQIRNSQAAIGEDLQKQEQDLSSQIQEHQQKIAQLTRAENDQEQDLGEEIAKHLGDCWKTSENHSAADILMARMDIEDKFLKIKETYRREVNKVEQAFQQEAEESDAAGSLEAAVDKCGGWTEEDHFKFVNVLRAAREHKRGRDKVTERLRLELPQFSPQEIASHERWFKLLQQKGSKKKDALGTMEREVKNWAKQGQQLMETTIEQVNEEAERRALLEEQQKQRAELAERLELLQKEKQEKDTKERLEAEALKLEKDAEEARREERRQEGIRKQKQAIALFRKKEAELLAALKAKEEERKMKEAEEKKKELEQAKVRSDFREQQRQKKLQQQIEARKEAEEREKARMELLEKIASQVPYFERLQEIEADLSKHTVFTQNNIFAAGDKARGFHPLFGFTDTKVFNDLRFKIGIALREAGIAHTAHAAAVVSQLAPRAPAPFANHL